MQTVLLDDIAQKLIAGQGLTDGDAEQLAATGDIVSLGMLADEVRRRLHGAVTTFVRVADVPIGAAAAYQGAPAGAREIRITGGFPGIDGARAAVRAVLAAVAVPVSGFELSDLELAAGADPRRLAGWLRELRADGLEYIAGAAIDRLQEAATAVGAVVDSGLSIARLVVHGGPAPTPLDVVRLVADLQRSTGAIRVFAPIPRHQGSEPTTGYEDVKRVALARILLGVPHIQADWALHGPKLAQVALTFGANDIDCVSPLDEVAEGRRRAPLEEIRRNIRAAALDPVERDGRFGRVG
jgi:aminodeoxyfutalosine synthase